MVMCRDPRHVICMVFRIPYAFQGAIYARSSFLEESSRSHVKSAASILSLTGIGGRVSLGFGLGVGHQHTNAASLWGHSFFFSGMLRNQHHQKTSGASSTFAIMIASECLCGTAMSQPERMSKIRCGSVWHPRLES